MTRTLLDVLEEANWIDAAVTLDGIPTADREALEVGLLLAEVERLGRTDLAIEHLQEWQGSAWKVTKWIAGGPAALYNYAPTLLAALTALLDQLPVPEARSSADLINDETTRRPAPDVERAEQ